MLVMIDNNEYNLYSINNDIQEIIIKANIYGTINKNWHNKSTDIQVLKFLKLNAISLKNQPIFKTLQKRSLIRHPLH